MGNKATKAAAQAAVANGASPEEVQVVLNTTAFVEQKKRVRDAAAERLKTLRATMAMLAGRNTPQHKKIQKDIRNIEKERKADLDRLDAEIAGIKQREKNAREAERLLILNPYKRSYNIIIPRQALWMAYAEVLKYIRSNPNTTDEIIDELMTTLYNSYETALRALSRQRILDNYNTGYKNLKVVDTNLGFLDAKYDVTREKLIDTLKLKRHEIAMKGLRGANAQDAEDNPEVVPVPPLPLRNNGTRKNRAANPENEAAMRRRWRAQEEEAQLAKQNARRKLEQKAKGNANFAAELDAELDSFRQNSQKNSELSEVHAEMKRQRNIMKRTRKNITKEANKGNGESINEAELRTNEERRALNDEAARIRNKRLAEYEDTNRHEESEPLLSGNKYPKQIEAAPEYLIPSNILTGLRHEDVNLDQLARPPTPKGKFNASNLAGLFGGKRKSRKRR